VLDTNVVSEALRTTPSVKVMEWMRSQPMEALFTTTITEGELFYGVALLEAGRRRDALEAAIMRVLEERFVGRILPFDSAAAREFADITAGRRRAGRPMSEADARIAAVARGVNRDAQHQGLHRLRVGLVDPWR
jgi:predicted nucleic acid-binding protein